MRVDELNCDVFFFCTAATNYTKQSFLTNNAKQFSNFFVVNFSHFFLNRKLSGLFTIKIEKSQKISPKINNNKIKIKNKQNLDQPSSQCVKHKTILTIFLDIRVGTKMYNFC